MITAIIIYLAIGILFNIFGRYAIDIRKNLSELKEEDSSGQRLAKWKIIIIILILRLLVIVAYPIFYINELILDSKNKKLQKAENIARADKSLYFEKMGGVGYVICFDCDFEQEVVGFKHGRYIDPYGNSGERWCSIGYQCQKCGKFHQINDDIWNSQGIRCECDGNLERDKPIFCPKCKSKNITYRMSYIT
jgi:hypothetical protein